MSTVATICFTTVGNHTVISITAPVTNSCSAHSGPIEQLLDYNRIRSGMYWIRF